MLAQFIEAPIFFIPAGMPRFADPVGTGYWGITELLCFTKQKRRVKMRSFTRRFVGRSSFLS
jgi:hypothetical protein